MSFTKKQLAIGSFALTGVLTITTTIGIAAAFGFCAYVVLTA